MQVIAAQTTITVVTVYDQACGDISSFNTETAKTNYCVLFLL